MMNKYTIIGIEILDKGYRIYTGKETDEGYKPYVQIYREHIENLRVNDVVELEYAMGRNGLYIKSIRKVVD